VTNLGLEERVFETTPRSAFLTIKDHEEDYMNNTKCRLINPTEPEIGRISKKILENVVNEEENKIETVEKHARKIKRRKVLFYLIFVVSIQAYLNSSTRGPELGHDVCQHHPRGEEHYHAVQEILSVWLK
jgi:hypothetical protein